MGNSFFFIHFLGFAGIPRRAPNYPDAYAGWNALASYGSILSVCMLDKEFTLNSDGFKKTGNIKKTMPKSFLEQKQIKLTPKSLE